jgi:hypothetical protein
MWNPFWLRTPVLLCLLALYVGLLIGLILLWHFAAVKNGIEPRLSKNYYSWTFGPTAGLVVVVSLWRQVDHECKSLYAWRELWNGSDASKTLLLDYVSPFQAKTLWIAVRNRHYSVIAGILGFGTLKLIVSQYLIFVVPELTKADCLFNRPSGPNPNNISQFYVSLGGDKEIQRQLRR